MYTYNPKCGPKKCAAEIQMRMFYVYHSTMIVWQNPSQTNTKQVCLSLYVGFISLVTIHSCGIKFQTAMMTSSNGISFALLDLCTGNSSVNGDFPSQRPVTRSFDVFFGLRPNKRLSKQSRRWWFETPLSPSWSNYLTTGFHLSLKRFIWGKKILS